MATLTGKVKFFNEQKAYGFIKSDSSDDEYFFHVSGTLEKVKKDDFVVFTLEEGQRGIKAVNVKHKDDGKNKVQ